MPTATYSKPSKGTMGRAKDLKRGSIKKLMPTVYAGAPYPPPPPEPMVSAPQQQVSEPVVGIGMNTGKEHFVVGDNPNGPEQLAVIPPRGTIASSVPQFVGGVRSYATGGMVTVGDGSTNRWDDNAKLWIDDATGNRMRPTDQGGDGRWRNPQGLVLNEATGQWERDGPAPVATQGTTVTNTSLPQGGDPLQNQTAARQASQGAQQGVINATSGAINAQNNVINAKQGTIAPTQAVIDASGRVVTAQEGQNQANREYLAQQQNANAVRLAEAKSIRAAESNIPDLTATAQAQTAYNDQKYLYDFAGVTPDTEVELPTGTNQQLAPGVRGKIMSQAELLTKESKANETERALKLDDARIAVALKGTDVAAAQAAAARAGLTLDQAELLVQQAQLEADRAGLTLDQWQNQAAQARLNEDITQNKPAGTVLYVDPHTGRSEYVTQAVKDERDYYYSKSGPGGSYQYDPATGNYTPLPLGQLSDSGVIAFGVGSEDVYGPFQNPYQGLSNTQRRQMAIDELVRRDYSPGLAAYLVDNAITQATQTQGEAGGAV